jgi:hypothetical protein
MPSNTWWTSTVVDYASIYGLTEQEKPAKPKSMKTIKNETIKAIRTVLRSKRNCMSNRVLIPNEKQIYSFSLAKERPNHSFVICPEDLFEVNGGIALQNPEMIPNLAELYGLGDPTSTRFNYDDNKIRLSMPERTMTKNMITAATDVAKMFKEVEKATISVEIRDEAEENRQYKAEREKVKTNLKTQSPQLAGVELRMAIDREIGNWETKIYKTILEV